MGVHENPTYGENCLKWWILDSLQVKSTLSEKERVVSLRGFNTPMHPCHGRKKNNVGKDNLNGPDDGLQINQQRIGKKLD